MKVAAMYFEGQGVKKDNAQAFTWFRKALAAGITDAQGGIQALAADRYAPAQNEIGVFYENGRGVPKLDSEAVDWYRAAADQGFAEAQYNLGRMYADGKGVPKNEANARDWFAKAAKQGHAAAKKRVTP